MKTFLAFIVENWLLIPLAVLAILLGQSWREGWQLKTDLADERAARAAENEARQTVVAQQETKRADVQSTHAGDTTTNLEQKNDRLQKVTAERDRAQSDARGLRNQIAAATRRDASAEADALTCKIDQLRLEEIGRLAGEGVELLAEGEGLLNEREVQLDWAIGQIAADRKAVEAMAQ